jgi:hypothetical protein
LFLALDKENLKKVVFKDKATGKERITFKYSNDK